MRKRRQPRQRRRAVGQRQRVRDPAVADQRRGTRIVLRKRDTAANPLLPPAPAAFGIGFCLARAIEHRQQQAHAHF